MNEQSNQEPKMVISRWDRGELAMAKMLVVYALAFVGCAFAIPKGQIVLLYVGGFLFLFALARFLPYREIIIDPRRSCIFVRDRIFLCFKRTTGKYNIDELSCAMLDRDHEPFRGWRFDPRVLPFRYDDLRVRVASYVEDPNVRGVPVLRVRLSGLSTEPGIELARFNAADYLKARAFTERVVRMTGATFYDRSTSNEVVRTADQIDKSLGERIAAGDINVQVVPRPKNTLVSFDNSGTELRFTRKTHRLSYRTLTVMVLMGCLAARYLVLISYEPQLFDPSKLRIQDVVHVPFLAACLVYFCCLIRWLLLFVTAGETLLVTRDSLQAWHRRIFRGSKAKIPVSRLEDLEWSDLGRGGGVLIARSDERELRFGDGLPVAEVAWIRSEVMQNLFSRDLPRHKDKPPVDQEELMDADLIEA